MADLRNPFKLRAAEHIESESNFLRLFAPGVLDLLPKDSLWTQVQVIHSAPGGGKTSLCRLFTPSSLNTLHDFKNGDEFKDLYQKLKSLDAITDQGPRVLGVMLPLGRNYAYMETLASNKETSQRLFYSLLNSRIILNALRGTLLLKKLPFPEGLSRIHVLRPPDADVPSNIPVPCTGLELFNWASTLEREICNSIDSFVSPESLRLSGHDTLYSLFLLKSENITFEGQPIADHSVVMFDDAHKLTSLQREMMLSNLFEMRMPSGIWIAERLQALKLKDLLPQGSKEGRDYHEFILENSWEVRSRLFERTAESIADRRTKLNPDVQIGSFSGLLPDTLDENEYVEKFSAAIERVQKRVNEKFGSLQLYDDWIRTPSLETDVKNKATKWRVLEILIERDSRNSQQKISKFLGMPLPAEEFEQQDDSSVRSGAEYFLSREFGFPYYFGFQRVADLASYNIEQFIEISGDLYEEMISAELLKQSSVLPPSYQEKILSKVAKRYWERIVKEIPNGRDAVKLLEAISKMCRWETDKPNAPYSPGVTGFAISMDERAILTDPEILKQNAAYSKLANTLHTCVSNNLLRAFPDRKQGKDGKEWLILYLNRLLCMHFGLPLQYGGWKHRQLRILTDYLEHGFRPPKRGNRKQNGIQEKLI